MTIQQGGCSFLSVSMWCTWHLKLVFYLDPVYLLFCYMNKTTRASCFPGFILFFLLNGSLAKRILYVFASSSSRLTLHACAKFRLCMLLNYVYFYFSPTLTYPF